MHSHTGSGKLSHDPRLCLQMAMDFISKCRQACDDLRKKTCATSVVLNQVCALVENAFTAILPIPLPRPDSSGKCIWANGDGSIDRATQLGCLEQLKDIALIYGSSSFSNTFDRSTDSVRAITVAAIMSIFDALLRLKPSDGQSTISQMVCGGEGAPYWLSTKAFDEADFTELTERMLLYTPDVLEARRGVIMYLTQSAESRGATKLFDWEWQKSKASPMAAMFQGGGSEPNFQVKEDDDTLKFVKAALEQLNVAFLPKEQGLKGGGGAREGRWEVVSEVEKYARWFVAESWEAAPEFGWYRDLHFLYQFCLEDTENFFKNNPNHPQLWSSSHGGVLPVFQFKDTDRDQETAFLRATVGDWRVNTKVSVDFGRRNSPGHPGVYIVASPAADAPAAGSGAAPTQVPIQMIAQVLAQSGMPQEMIQQVLAQIKSGNVPPELQGLIQMISMMGGGGAGMPGMPPGMGGG